MKLSGEDQTVQNIGIRFGFVAAIVLVLAAFLSFGFAEPQAMIAPAVGRVPLSLVLAAAMIIFAVALTGLYVLLANRSTR